jgi:hypothetical protein
MQRWKEGFDQQTQMPKAPPLPTVFFINHGHSNYETGVGTTVEVTPELKAKCKELKELAEPAGIFHMNPMSGDGVEDAFRSFL